MPCVEEIALLQGSIDRNQLRALIQPLEKSGYGRYLSEILSLSAAGPVVGVA